MADQRSFHHPRALLDIVVRFLHCGSLVGQEHIGGAHTVGRLVPQRARSTLRSQIGPWRHSQPLIPAMIAQSCRGHRHRTSPRHVDPHDPWHLTKRSRLGIPTAQVPRIRGNRVIEDPHLSGAHKLDHAHTTWQLSIYGNRPCRWNTDPIERMIPWRASAMQNTCTLRPQ